MKMVLRITALAFAMLSGNMLCHTAERQDGSPSWLAAAVMAALLVAMAQ